MNLPFSLRLIVGAREDRARRPAEAAAHRPTRPRRAPSPAHAAGGHTRLPAPAAGRTPTRPAPSRAPYRGAPTPPASLGPSRARSATAVADRNEPGGKAPAAASLASPAVSSIANRSRGSGWQGGPRWQADVEQIH